MACNGAYATAEEYAQFWCIEWPPASCEAQESIELALRLTAGRIHLARQSVGACDCALSEVAETALKELNSILAAVMYNCPCGGAGLSADMKSLLMADAQATLEAIGDGRLEVCDGHTGSNFPAQAFAQQAVTPWRTAEMLYDEMLREG